MFHQRVIRCDRDVPVDVALDVPVGRVSLGKQGVDSRVTAVVQSKQLACLHVQICLPHVYTSVLAVAMGSTRLADAADFAPILGV